MKDRIHEIIRYKTGGRIGAFGALLGWSPQYTSKVLRGDGIGLTPVRAILEAFPDINARWLILGEGDMLDGGDASKLRHEAMEQVRTLAELDKYIPIMSELEVRRLVASLSAGRLPQFAADDFARWEFYRRANERATDKVLSDAVEQATSK